MSDARDISRVSSSNTFSKLRADSKGFLRQVYCCDYGVWRLEFFSLGGLLGLVWKPRLHTLPWLLAALVLVGVGSWDVTTRLGRVDFMLMASLAGYELIIGLTEERQADE